MSNARDSEMRQKVQPPPPRDGATAQRSQQTGKREREKLPECERETKWDRETCERKQRRGEEEEKEEEERASRSWRAWWKGTEDKLERELTEWRRGFVGVGSGEVKGRKRESEGGIWDIPSVNGSTECECKRAGKIDVAKCSCATTACKGCAVPYTWSVICLVTLCRTVKYIIVLGVHFYVSTKSDTSM